MAGLYSEKPSDLPPEISKKKRSKVHIAVYMAKLLNLMYLSLKYERARSLKFESFESLVRSREFVKSVLAKAGNELDDASEFYINKFISLMDRNYVNVLSWLEDVWDLALSRFGAVHNLLHIPSGSFGVIFRESAGITGSGRPLRLRIPKFQMIFLEGLLGSPGSLVKSTVYLGRSLKTPELNLDLAVRLPLKKDDLETAFSYQYNSKIYYIVNENFEVYPFLLRARRISYGRLSKGGPINDVLRNIIASRFVPANILEDIIHGEFPLDVVLMMPHIYLNGALSFLAVFRGRHEEPLLAQKTVKIQISDELFVTGFRSGTAVLPVNIRPGSYIYIVAIPVTYPKVASVLATLDESRFLTSDLESSFTKPLSRHGKRFMSLNELLTRW
jgi:hypothetical protein